MTSKNSKPGFLASLAFLTGCGGLPVVEVPSANYSYRVDYVVLHFTSESFADSLRILTRDSDNPVSSHYLVPETGDETYDHRSLRIYQLVPESERAWHAGQSYWHGEESLNDRSIGIEIVNRSYCRDNDPLTETPTPEDQTCSFLDYSEDQLTLVVELVNDIVNRYPDLDPVDVIGHGDISTVRRVDPGPKFPWKRLYDNGVGAWYDDDTVDKYQQHFTQKLPQISAIQRALRAYGYDVVITGLEDPQTRFAVRAFQIHFRPGDFSATIDVETVAILFALLEKYRRDELELLLTG